MAKQLSVILGALLLLVVVQCATAGRQAAKNSVEEFSVRDPACSPGLIEDKLTVTEEVVPVIDDEAPIAAPRWGPFRRGRCLRRARGFRRYTARLLGVRGGNWNTTCLSTPATFGSHRNIRPVRCLRNRRGQIIGDFQVRDRRCRRISDLEEAVEFEVETDLEIEEVLRIEEALKIEEALESEESFESQESIEDAFVVEEEAADVENTVNVEAELALG